MFKRCVSHRFVANKVLRCEFVVSVLSHELQLAFELIGELYPDHVEIRFSDPVYM